MRNFEQEREVLEQNMIKHRTEMQVHLDALEPHNIAIAEIQDKLKELALDEVNFKRDSCKTLEDKIAFFVDNKNSIGCINAARAFFKKCTPSLCICGYTPEVNQMRFQLLMKRERSDVQEVQKDIELLLPFLTPHLVTLRRHKTSFHAIVFDLLEHTLSEDGGYSFFYNTDADEWCVYYYYETDPIFKSSSLYDALVYLCDNHWYYDPTSEED